MASLGDAIRQVNSDTLALTGFAKRLLDEELAQPKPGGLKRFQKGANLIEKPLTFGGEEKTHHP